MPNTLGLDDDLDDVEVLRRLEDSFGIKFFPDEIKIFKTVGDIYDVLRKRFSLRDDSAQACATAMAFYRLRRALKETGITARLTPATAMSDISSLPPKILCQKIQAGTDFHLPNLAWSRLGQSGSYALLVGILTAIPAAVLHSSWVAMSTILFAGGVILTRLDHRLFPNDCQTLGDFTRKVAGLNFGILLANGARYREKDLWNALVEVLSEHSVLPKAEIGPETVLLQSQLRAA